MRKEITELAEFAGVEDVLIEGTDAYGQAMALLTKGIMPDGEKWKDGKPKIFVGFGGAVDVTKVKKKVSKDGAVFSFSLRFAPGKGGGGGVSIPATASNHFFNLVGTGKADIAAMSKAFQSVARGSLKAINTDVSRWMHKPENWVHRLVGWTERDNWVPQLKGMQFRKVVIDAPMVDPTRRKWPSGRTEIWAPLKVEVQVPMKRKV